MEKNKNPVVYLFGKMWKYSAGNRKNVVLYAIMFVISECINTFLSPLVLAKMIDVVIREGVNDKTLLKLLALSSILLVRPVISWAFHGPARIIERKNAFRIRANYREYLLKGVMGMPLEWHTDHHSGDTIDKINKGTDALYNFSEDSFEIIKPIISLAGSIGMILYFSPVSLLLILGMMLLGAYITVRMDKIIGPQYRELNRSENSISESIFDSISNISTVIILRVEKLVFDAIVRKVMAPFDLFRKNIVLNEWKWALVSFCCHALTVFVLGVYYFQNKGIPGAVTAASVYLLLNYMEKICDLFFNFTGLYSQTIRRKFNVLNAEELADEFRSASLSNHVLPGDWQELCIKNLTFSYGQAEDDVHLNSVTSVLKKGEKIALVGVTGSGKTTFLKLLRDLYHPQSLELSVDNVPIPHGFEGISRAISLVPQNPEIFATTILENITLGADYSPELVRRYTDMACFTDVVEGLPRGLKSSIKEKGVNLSGGQVQRLALSRGLLACHEKDIVLLDEPTASLDLGTEMTVYHNIFEGFRGKTIISSIHRLYLLPMFDMIYMFDNGGIVGKGNVRELNQSCPEFQKLWAKQFENV